LFVLSYIMEYVKRISDSEISKKLDASGAVLVRGPKACGKTESAKQLANSVLRVDRDDQVQLMFDVDPQRLLHGNTPRLIDEWQLLPGIWNLVRHEVDERKLNAQFILTGSANPEEDAKMHSGAGRFTIVDMRTMSWQELGLSSGLVSMADLFKGVNIHIQDQKTELDLIVNQLVKGGFPSLLDNNVDQAIDLNRAYVELLAEVDMSRVSKVKRDPIKVRNLLRSLARNTSTMVDMVVLEKDIREYESKALSRPTLYDYMDTLHRLMILEDQPAWNTHIRSSNTLRTSPKRHFTDTSLAVAALGATPVSLLDDLTFTGFLFESMVTHDLRVYAQANDAKVYHYRDSSGLEVDSIVQKYNGEWSAFEIKLGTAQIDEAASNLLRFASLLDNTKTPAPKSLNIITGTGQSYTRKDGVNVISFASLGA
jgi:predicted AAA+ superfamily ATPase